MGLFDAINQRLQGWGYADQQGQLGHAGSWGGAKDYGVSELIKGQLVSPAYAAENDWSGSYGVMPPSNQNPNPQNPNPQNPNPQNPNPQNPNPGDNGGNNPPSNPEVDFSDYYRQLDEMLGGLDLQKTSQEANYLSQYNQGVSDLQLQERQGLDTLGTQRTETTTNQSKNLRDLASNLRNSMLAGNIYLGARGAGDSSAANMYSYALTKLGNQQRGDIIGQTSDILAEIGKRESGIKDTVQNEARRLKSVYDQGINNISTWFANAQNQIRGLKAEGAKEKSQAAYNFAISQLQTLQQDNANKQSVLNQWAANNLKDINGVRAQVEQSSSYYPLFPKAQQIAGQPVSDSSGNVSVSAPAGYGQSKEKVWNPYTGRYE